MSFVQLLPALLCLPCLAGLLLAIHREQPRLRALTKTLCSLSFLATGLLSSPGGQGWAWAGLGLSFLGDLLLLGESRRALAAGLVAFLAAHGCYLAWVGPGLEPAQLAPWSALLALPLLVAGAWILRAAWPRLGGLRGPVALYFLALGGLTWVALASWLAQGQDPRAPGPALRALGLVAFFASDLSVARHRLVAPGLVNKLWGLPAYYLAQHLLALSLRWPAG